MENPLLAPHREGQELVHVLGRIFRDEANPTAPMLVAITLHFERAEVTISATPEDEVTVSGQMPDCGDDTREIDLSESEPWKGAIGKPLIWSWSMTNQQGYADGAQLEFAENVETQSVTIQLIAVASQLEVRTIGRRFRP